MKFFVIFMCALSCFQSFCEAAKILVILPLHGKSHFAPFEPILKRLAERGHELKVVSSFPQKIKISNLIDIDVSSRSLMFVETMDVEMYRTMTPWSSARLLWKFGNEDICKPLFEHPQIGFRIYCDEPSYQIAKNFFGADLPTLEELRSKVALVKLNGHHSLTTPRLLAPGIKEVGGIHIPSSGPSELPRDLKEYLDSAVEGVVYFSMGSIVNATFPDEILTIFSAAFTEIPQQVLWKCDEQRIPQLPKNVKCLALVPQLSVLCHPNVRVFISHGGLFGTQEAVYYGVPIFGMPLVADQFSNVAAAVYKGFALKVDFFTLTSEKLVYNINKLLTNNRYAERAREASRKFRDRPQPPLEEAVFWIEYILRHGPEALKTASSELAWYQYLLFDVIAGLVLVPVLLLWALSRWATAIFSCCKRKTKLDRKYSIEGNLSVEKKDE